MEGIGDIIISMFSYTFIVRAVIVGFLVSLCASLLGVSLVLKRYSMIGDGLSHVGFAALAVATAFNMAPLSVSIPVTAISAFLLLRLSEHSKIRGDAAIAIFSTSALAIGVMVISLTTGMNTDVCNYLFGSILAMSKADVRLSIVLSIAVIFLFVVFYNKIFAVTFDENFARATGVKAGLYNMILALLTAVTIVLGMRMMGALLISSLIIFPSLTSMRLFKSFRSVTVSAALISIFCFLTGVVVSYIFATPIGASVVIINILLFAVFSLLGVIRNNSRRYVGVLGLLILTAGIPLTMGSCTERSVFNTPAHLPDKSGSIIEIQEKMFIAQINDIYLNTGDYLDKTIKLEGIFRTFNFTGRDHYYVMRNSPGCCGNDGSVGFEVSWPDTAKADNFLTEGYPEPDDWVAAEGKLAYYETGGISYLYLVLSSLEIKPDRGAEFVAR